MNYSVEDLKAAYFAWNQKNNRRAYQKTNGMWDIEPFNSNFSSHFMANTGWAPLDITTGDGN